MDNIAGQKSSLVLVTNLTVLLLVLIWLIPTIGLLVSSFRDRDQISESGWWRAPFSVELPGRVRPEPQATPEGDVYVMDGSVYGLPIDGNIAQLTPEIPLGAFGVTAREPGAYALGDTVIEWEFVPAPAYEDVLDDDDVRIVRSGAGAIEEPTLSEITAVLTDGGEDPLSAEAQAALEDPDALTLTFVEALTVNADGSYRFVSAEEPSRGPSIYLIADTPPDFTLENYDTVLGGDGMLQAFVNTLTVTIPATVIPILIAAFAAYALAWMDFPGRGLLIAAVVGLLVVPLQLALVPLLRLHQQVGIGQSFVGIWLAHTGFGLPLAIYLLRNYMVGLPRDIIESAKVDGATDFQIFTRIILPLSFPALASFAIFQFLWTWNDLLVAKVFLPSNDDSWVMTVRIADDLLGSRGGDWGILAAAAFVSIAVPILVFFTAQRYLVRGLLAGSVK